MGVTVRTYSSGPGLFHIHDAALSNTVVYMVARAGTVYTRREGSPGNLGFVYDAGAGRIEFENEFADPVWIDGRPQYEQVTVMFRI